MSLASTKRHITIPQRGTWEFVFTWKTRKEDAEGNPLKADNSLADPEDPETWVWLPVDLSGATFAMQIRSDVADIDVTAELTATSQSGHITLSAVDGVYCKISIKLGPDDTDFAPEFEGGVYDIMIFHANGDVDIPFYGNAIPRRTVTRVAV